MAPRLSVVALVWVCALAVLQSVDGLYLPICRSQCRTRIHMMDKLFEEKKLHRDSIVFETGVSNCMSACAACKHTVENLAWASQWVARPRWRTYVEDRCSLVRRGRSGTCYAISAGLFQRNDLEELLSHVPQRLGDRDAMDKFVFGLCQKGGCCEGMFRQVANPNGVNFLFSKEREGVKRKTLSGKISRSVPKAPLPVLGDFYDTIGLKATQEWKKEQTCIICKKAVAAFADLNDILQAEYLESLRRSNGSPGESVDAAFKAELKMRCENEAQYWARATWTEDGSKLTSHQAEAVCIAIADEMVQTFGPAYLVHILNNVAEYQWVDLKSFTDYEVDTTAGADGFCSVTFCSQSSGMWSADNAVTEEVPPDEYTKEVAAIRLVAYGQRFSQLLEQEEILGRMNGLAVRTSALISKVYTNLSLGSADRCDSEECFVRSYTHLAKALKRATMLRLFNQKYMKLERDFKEGVEKSLGLLLGERSGLARKRVAFEAYIASHEEEREEKEYNEEHIGVAANGLEFMVGESDLSSLIAYEHGEELWFQNQDYEVQQMWERGEKELGEYINRELKAAMLNDFKKGNWKEVGRGGTGVVYKTMFLGKDVVVKRFRPMFEGDFEIFKSEVLFADRISKERSDRFISYYGFFPMVDIDQDFADGLFCVVYEYMDFSLSKLLDTWKLEDETYTGDRVRLEGRSRVIRKVAAQLIEGISVLEGMGYSHRDLKVENVLMRNPYLSGELNEMVVDIKIIDFDRAIKIDKDGLAPDASGQSEYPVIESSTLIMPPEAIFATMMYNYDGGLRTDVLKVVDAIAAFTSTPKNGGCVGLSDVNQVVCKILGPKVKKMTVFGSTDCEAALSDYVRKNYGAIAKTVKNDDEKWLLRAGPALDGLESLSKRDFVESAAAIQFLAKQMIRAMVKGYDVWSIGVILLQLAVADRNVMYSLYSGVKLQDKSLRCKGICDVDIEREAVPPACLMQASMSLLHRPNAMKSFGRSLGVLESINVAHRDTYLSISLEPLSRAGMDFVFKLLRLNPVERMGAKVAHLHPYVSDDMDEVSVSDPVPFEDPDLAGDIPKLESCASTCDDYFSKSNERCMAKECFICTSLMAGLDELKTDETIGPKALEWWCENRIFPPQLRTRSTEPLLARCRSMADEMASEGNLEFFSEVLKPAFQEQLVTMSKRVCKLAGCCKHVAPNMACGAGSAPLQLQEASPYTDLADLDIEVLLNSFDDDDEDSDDDSDDDDELQSLSLPVRPQSCNFLLSKSMCVSQEMEKMRNVQSIWDSRQSLFQRRSRSSSLSSASREDWREKSFDSLDDAMKISPGDEITIGRASEPLGDEALDERHECSSKCTLCKYLVSYFSARILMAPDGSEPLVDSMRSDACRDFINEKTREGRQMDGSYDDSITNVEEYAACMRFGNDLSRMTWIQATLSEFRSDFVTVKTDRTVTKVGKKMANIVCSQALCCTENCERATTPSIVDRVGEAQLLSAPSNYIYFARLWKVYAQSETLYRYENLRKNHQNTVKMNQRILSPYNWKVVLSGKRSFSWQNYVVERTNDDEDIEAWLELYRDIGRDIGISHMGMEELWFRFTSKLHSAVLPHKILDIFSNDREGISARVVDVVTALLDEIRKSAAARGLTSFKKAADKIDARYLSPITSNYGKYSRGDEGVTTTRKKTRKPPPALKRTMSSVF